jgi:Matrixin
MSTRLTAALLGAAVFALASRGSAFCRATTCADTSCDRDENNCLTTGTPLFWASSCMQVYVQANGAPTQGISFDTAKASVGRAFNAWLTADCGGAAPYLEVQVLGPISCDTAEYNSTQRNANIVLFREDDWPYIGAEDALGFTDLHFDSNTGELWDADLEVNAFAYTFSVGDPVTANDLDAMLTHEAGHMLGLAHTPVSDATMFATYMPGSKTQRTLADDDVQAVCAAYPADRMPSTTSCTPRHGFSDACAADQPANDKEDAQVAAASTSKGCAIAAPASDWCPAPLAALCAALAVCWGRRRSRHHLVSCRHAARRG